MCKESTFWIVLKFHLGNHGLFEELGRHVKGGGPQDRPNCGACKVLVEHHMIPRD